MDKTLLEKAKAHPVGSYTVYGSKKSVELEELAIAYFRGDLAYSQVCKVLSTSGSSVYGVLGCALRRAVAAGRVTII